MGHRTRRDHAPRLAIGHIFPKRASARTDPGGSVIALPRLDLAAPVEIATTNAVTRRHSSRGEQTVHLLGETDVQVVPARQSVVTRLELFREEHGAEAPLDQRHDREAGTAIP